MKHKIKDVDIEDSNWKAFDKVFNEGYNQAINDLINWMKLQEKKKVKLLYLYLDSLVR
jgi:hypothetical protein